MIAEREQHQSRTVAAPLCRFDEMPIGIGMTFMVNDRSIAVFRLRGGDVRAVDNRCPHGGGPLADGIVAGPHVVCPLHAYRYRLDDGTCDSADRCGVSAYQASVLDGWVHVEVPR